MKSKIYKSSSVEETKKIAASILSMALDKKRQGALVLALEGELGAGKTHFAQGIAKYLEIERNVTSPTFVLMKKYSIAKRGLSFKRLYHLDCYRVYSSDEILDLGWQDITSDSTNIILVEWAERIEDIIPKDAVWINFKNIKSNSKNERIIEVKVS